MAEPPPSVLETLRKAEAFLAGKGVEQPRLEAERLFSVGLGCKRLDLYLRYAEPLNEMQLDRLRELTVRRGKGEPWQYLAGEVEFHGLALTCDTRALIPRPETEELVARVVERLKDAPPARIVDLGTGSGAIALSLAAAFPEAAVTAVDNSSEALSLARQNTLQLSLAERVSLYESDWFAAVSDDFDLIVSNPPYLTEVELQTAGREVRDYEPPGALVAGPDGLRDLRVILAGTREHLAPGGLLALETGIEQHEALCALAEGFGKCWGENDLTGRPRYFFVQA